VGAAAAFGAVAEMSPRMLADHIGQRNGRHEDANVEMGSTLRRLVLFATCTVVTGFVLARLLVAYCKPPV
jgi:hypothetical protein